MDGCKSVIFDEMKRILPILIFLVSACSHSREACDAYSADSGSGSVSDRNKPERYRSVPSPDFSDSVAVPQAQNLAMEEVAVQTIMVVSEKKSAEFKQESVSISTSNQQLISATYVELANLNSSISAQRTQRNPAEQDQVRMNKDVQLLGQIAPESFEYNLYKYVSGNYDVSRISFLEKAAELQPSNKEVVLQLASYFVCMDDDIGSLNYLDKWSRGLSKDQKDLTYSIDLLNSIDENGILVVHGINDTYSTLLQQLKYKFRTDIQIVSLELLQSQQYRKSLISKGIKLPDSALIDRRYLEALCQLNKEKNPFLSMTIPKEYLTGMSSRLFAVGLTFEYSEQVDFDNFYRNELLWNSKLSKDLLKELQQKENRTSTENELVANYLPMLLQMRQVYVQKNELDRTKEIDFVLDQIGNATGKMDLIEKIKQGQQ